MPNLGETGDALPENLLALAQSDPRRVVTLTDNIAPESSPGDVITMYRARAIALRVLGNYEKALVAIEQATVRAEATGDEQIRARCLMSAAPLFAYTGEVDRAFAALDEADQTGDELHRADVTFQRAGVALLIADWRQAHHYYSEALPIFREHERFLYEADALLGRGLMAAYMGDLSSSRVDLAQAASLFEGLDDVIGVGQSHWNQALAEAIAGDPADAIPLFDNAAQLLVEAEFPVEYFLGDQAEALFAVGLHEEAIALAHRCVAAYDQSAQSDASRRNVLDAASRRLELARTHALMGEWPEAAQLANAIGDDFDAQGQPRRRTFADIIALECELGTEPATDDLVDAAEHLHRRLRGSAQPEWRCAPLLIRARAELALGRTDDAAKTLARVGRLNRTLLLDLTRLELGAQLRLETGDLSGTTRWVRKALQSVHARAGMQGSSWIAAAHTRKLEVLTDLGLQAAITNNDAAGALALLAIAEDSTSITPVTSDTSELVTEARSLTKAVNEALGEGRDSTPIEKRRDEVARQLRIARTDRSHGDEPTPTPSRAALVTWLAAGGQAYLLQGSGGGTAELTHLGPVDAIAQAISELCFLLQRAFRKPSERNLEMLAEAAAETDGTLGLTSLDLGRNQTIHLHAMAGLGSIPFGHMPSLRDVPWVRTERLTGELKPIPTDLDLGLISGPDLTHADIELDRLADLVRQPAAQCRQASCDDALGVLAKTALVHIAAHSNVHHGNPMFSSIQFADGELSLFELESQQSVPQIAVLASCESGAGTRVGLRELGISAALLAAGIDLVIGTALPIPDSEDTIAVMASLHAALRHADPARAVNEMDRSALSPLGGLIADTLLPHSRLPFATPSGNRARIG